jgi:hypothetical protein
LLKIQGLDGDGKMFTRANALLWNESQEAFVFAFKTAVPQLWGKSVCEATSVFLTDGDPQMISALRVARLTVFPNVTLKRCFWHLIHQEISKIFGNGEHDLEVNRIVRGWLNSLAYQVESPEDFRLSMDALKVWIASNVDVSLMPRRKKDVVQISRKERMLQFVTNVESLKKCWAKCYRVGLCDLGHITTALSEAGFAKLKGGNLAVHAQMGLNATVETMKKQDKLSMKQSACAADRQVTTRPMRTINQTALANRLGKYVTRNAVDVLDRQAKKAQKMSSGLVGRGRWHVVYKPKSSAVVLEVDSDSDDEDQSSEQNRPWPVFVYTREVYLKAGKLFCSCGLTKSMLLPCAHILCVKNGACSVKDCHFRSSLMWQAGRIPLSQLSRSHDDQDFGVSTDGVHQSELEGVGQFEFEGVEQFELPADDASSVSWGCDDVESGPCEALRAPSVVEVRATMEVL